LMATTSQFLAFILPVILKFIIEIDIPKMLGSIFLSQI
jgi:hypothetical protein